jgi:hypothetical protein
MWQTYSIFLIGVLMPNYRGHVFGGCVVYVAVLAILNSYCISGFTALEWFLCTFAGALFPDIDTKSRGQKYFYWLVLVTLLFLIYRERFDLLAIISVCVTLPLLSKHRGIFHHFWFVTLVPLGIWFFIRSFRPDLSDQLLFDTVFFIAGALSHLWLDFYFVPTMRYVGLYKKRRG